MPTLELIYCGTMIVMMIIVLGFSILFAIEDHKYNRSR